MPEVTITIGGRPFQVACQDGEQDFLRSAAALLDAEAQVVLDQVGRLPEDRVLLMSGLMLADKTAGMQDQLHAAESQIRRLERELETIKAAPPERVEVPVIPPSVTETLAELAARAESLAERVEEEEETT
ncbi:cell division protein ZapA [Poseidonocella pacifica]|uniref:Cell division protein ZapA n=1 Tax=Poseidonocella pacifica TaxID=871651 RepID=A0A1I0VST0_9RHOB|nr:cell division protein ZapA [Poseidonocella pacifica]SFA79023.1 cell division protein ZapA [Poseidonocella pacifica]